MASPAKDLTDQIEICELVAQGGFSNVHRGIWTVNPSEKYIVAVKILRPYNIRNGENASELLQRRLKRESRNWGDLKHCYVLKFYGIYQKPGQSAMVSPFCQLGNVVSFLREQGSNADRPRMIFHISEGLEYLHSRNIVHGDLKGNNILIGDDKMPLLSDFGRTKLLEEEHEVTTGFTGAGRYLAPELLASEDDAEDEEFKAKLTKASDVYGFGMVGLEILTGSVPFAYIKADQAVPIRVAQGKKPRKPILSDYYNSTWEVLDRCWVTQPAARPGISTIVQDMSRRVSRSG